MYSGEGVKGAGRKREREGEVEGEEGEGREEGIDGLQVCDAKKGDGQASLLLEKSAANEAESASAC